MGFSFRTHEVLEDKILLRRLLDYYEMFGRKATVRKFDLTDAIFKSILKFCKEFPNYLPEDKEDVETE